MSLVHQTSCTRMYSTCIIVYSIISNSGPYTIETAAHSFSFLREPHFLIAFKFSNCIYKCLYSFKGCTSTCTIPNQFYHKSK